MIATKPSARREDVARILAQVDHQASARTGPALVVLVGLPASGKSRVAEALRARTGAAVLESDALRRLLVRRRTYAPIESRRLFEAIHEAIEALLSQGVSVILDATNVSEAERTPLYRIAERSGARLVLVQVAAPASLIQERLEQRGAAGDGASEADRFVYERMRDRVEEIRRPHHVVDTSGEVEPLLEDIAREMTGP